MDWDHTNPTCNWDAMSKLELQDSTNYHQQHYGGGFVSSSDHQSAAVMNNMFSVDLKLGRLEDMSDLSVDNTVKNSEELSMNMGSSQQISGSSRTRGRGRNSAGAQTVVYCSVDGCNSDLSQCREYHRRHRVCERHSKTPVVLIAGKEQRFCQQCSRFHSLGEFDEVKRSCRKRLDGHNRRRRKTQPQNFYINSGSLHSSNTGNGLMQFRNLQMQTSSPWPVLPQPDQEASTMYNHYDPLASLSDNLSWSTICTRSNDHHPLLTNCATLTAPTSSCNNSKGAVKVSEPGISLTQASHSECALSLLSRHPARSSGLYNPTTHTTHQARSSPLGFGSTLHLNDGFAQFSGTQAMEDESSASLSSTSNDNSGHSFGGLFTGQDGFCTNNSSRVFPFTWG